MRTRTLLLVGAILSALSMDARAESAVRPTVMISNLVVVEGDTGMTPFTATVTYNNTYYATTPLTVLVTATPGTASDKDFVFAPTELVLGTDAGVQTVSGFIVGDIEPEYDETFWLTATPVGNDGGYASYFYSSGGMVTIQDDDQARGSRLHVEGATVLEGDRGMKQAEVRVVLEPASTSEVKVKYQSQDGTAVAKSDYLPVSGTLSFAPGEVLKTITIDILGDTALEADESFVVVLSDASMALLGTPRAEVVIANDDVASTPPDALPPIDATDAQPDGGVGEGRVDAHDDATVVDGRGELNGFDARPDNGGNDSGALVAVTTDTGIPRGSDSGPGEAVAPAPNDSGVPGNSPNLNSGCSCSVGAAGSSAGTAWLVGAALALWLARRRRTSRGAVIHG